jgi:O-antigen/teichoic acid export membrane protein
VALKPFDSAGAWLPAVETSGLRRRAVRGASITVFAQGSAFAVQMIATVVLARLLVPGDFGVVTMVTTFSVLLMSCGRVGLPDAVLQRDEIDHFLASNLFWVNIGTALVLTIGFAAAGSLLARFYGDPRVAHVAAGLSLTIFVDSTSILHLALLKRAMRFSAVSANDIVARAASVVVSIALAWAGFGYWALVGGAVALPLSTTIGAWILCRWVPSLPRRVPGTGAMVRFAIHVFGRYSLGYTAQNTDNLLVGWRFGSGALGLYKKAYDLFILPFSLLNVFPVVVSTLSRLTKDRSQYRRYFLSGLSMLALVGMAVAADLTLVGRDLVRLLLGPKWEEAGRIFVYFGPGIGAQLIYSTYGMIHLSIGTTARFLRWGFIEVTATLALFVLALPWGPVGLAVAWTASYWLLLMPAFWYAGRPIQLGVGAIIGAIWKFVLASLLAGWGCVLAVRQLPSLGATSYSVGALERIITTSLVFGVLYLSAVVLLHGGGTPIYRLGELLGELAPGKKSSNSIPAVSACAGNDGSVANG